MNPWLTLRSLAGLPDLRDAHPVTGPERLPGDDGGLSGVWWILTALACAGVLLALALRRRPAAEPTDDEWIQLQLADLEAATADPRFAHRLTDFLRSALRRRWSVPDSAQTTSEIAAALASAPLSADARAAWRSLFERCDLAMFAAWPMSPVEAAQALRTAQTLLSETLSVSESLRVG